MASISAILPQSLKEARDLGSKYYFTGRPCKRGHITKRYTSTQTCSECEQTRSRAYYAENSAAMLDYARSWRGANRGKHNQHQANRYASKVRATPDWLLDEQLDQMSAVYELASTLSEATGVKFEVDHIEPLLSSEVCGLHVPWNLQILTKDENQRKGSRRGFY